jgi:hypothetical protein
MTDKMTWSMIGAFNAAIERPERDVQPRDYLWATDLGKADVDTYLKMMGEEPSNPPNARSMHKFMAGDFWEGFVYWFLTFAGILRSSQERLTYQYPDLLMVSGRPDFIAGGRPDYEKALALTVQFPMTDPVRDFILRFIKNMRAEYEGKDLKEIVIECKSVGSFIFPRYQRANATASIDHVYQIFHYLKSQARDEGHIAYFSKDDSLMAEFGVFNPDAEIEAKYRGRIETLTGYYRAKQQPPLENEIVFDEEAFRFAKNWKIEYSPFLTKLYGYKTPEAYYQRWQPKAAQFNRVFGRCVAGEKMTKMNLEVLPEMRAYFPNLDELIIKAQEAAKEDPTLLGEEAQNGNE